MDAHGNEGVSLFKLFALLIIVLTITGLVVGLFNMFYSGASDKANELDSAASAAENALYAQYDGKIVSGKEVKSCAEIYRGREMAIVVKTAKAKDGAAKNYNAVLEVDANGNPSTGPDYAAKFSKEESRITSYGIHYDDNGLVVYNNDLSSMSDKSDPNYVQPNGKFEAKLIQDDNETIVGFYFKQLSSSDGDSTTQP